MGCDIHTYVERLVESDGNNEWVTADLFYKPRWRCEGEPEFKVYHAYRGRYYDLFATLADVRNGSGNEFIDSPRGLPSDCCETVKSEHDRCSEDWHSASWFTLKELKDWQKNHARVIKHSGMMSPEDAERVDGGKMPLMWCQGTNDKTFVYREWVENADPLKGFIEAIEKVVEREVWVSKDEIDKFSDKFRVVFWFDN